MSKEDAEIDTTMVSMVSVIVLASVDHCLVVMCSLAFCVLVASDFSQ